MDRQSKSQEWGRSRDRWLVVIACATLLPLLLSFVRLFVVIDQTYWAISIASVVVVGGLSGALFLEPVLRRRHWSDGAKLLDGLWLPRVWRFSCWASIMGFVVFGGLTQFFGPATSVPEVSDEEVRVAAETKQREITDRAVTPETAVARGESAVLNAAGNSTIPGNYEVSRVDDGKGGTEVIVIGWNPPPPPGGSNPEDPRPDPPEEGLSGSTTVTTVARGRQRGFNIGDVLFPYRAIAAVLGLGSSEEYHQAMLKTIYDVSQGQPPSARELESLARQVPTPESRDAWKAAMAELLEKARDEGKIDDMAYRQALSDLETVSNEEEISVRERAFLALLKDTKPDVSPEDFRTGVVNVLGTGVPPEALRNKLKTHLDGFPKFTDRREELWRLIESSWNQR